MVFLWALPKILCIKGFFKVVISFPLDLVDTVQMRLVINTKEFYDSFSSVLKVL